ncbi:hypothetical protein H7E67_09660 [Clostridium gasigenes]|uniref:hypothetical protein n=1 Tax=Clostridium gasigenes TaxID=94869 RepID=UPI001628FBCC|nr:hypothetical protein [Clostridium gasigenes]MBB6623696.1 hypothetical protein [Clostridium gasigenes]MBU3088828.1 hypothetical protein [Clostridium gasigenes]
MNSLKNLRFLIAINIIFLIILIILKNDNFTYIFLIKFCLISILNSILVLRMKSSYSILSKIRNLEKLDFPKYKDITLILTGLILLIVIYLCLFLDYFNVISIFQPLGKIDTFNKILLIISTMVLVIISLLSNISGVIIRPYFHNGIEIFEVNEHNVMCGNEILNRATGSFKNGIIIGYYIFYFEDIKEKYKDKSGKIILTGAKNHPFKIVINSQKSKSYFSDIFNIY